MRYEEIDDSLATHRLEILGGFHPGQEDALPEACGTLLLIGPREPGFWDHVTADPEFTDGRADPLDRWSRRVIGRLACDLGAKAYFPFGGPPWRPFIDWALRSGRAWASPVTLLVHDRAGLMVSYRGALGLRDRIALPDPPGAPPCASCAAPCVTACPVAALTATGYDIDACHAFLYRAEGRDCLEEGCRARRACPVSATYGRRPEQSAFHMRSFHP